MKQRPLAQRVFRKVTAFHVWMYQVTNGHLGGKYRLGAGWRRPAPVLLLDHRGRRSGKQFTTPLIFARDGKNIILVASQGGHPRNPNWFHNLTASPETHIQIGDEKVAVRARIADPDERKSLWPLVVDVFADYEKYQARTSRSIPLVIV